MIFAVKIDQWVLDHLNPVYTIVDVDALEFREFIKRGSHGNIIDITRDGVLIGVDYNNGRILHGLYRVTQFLTANYDQKSDMTMMKRLMDDDRRRAFPWVSIKKMKELA